MFGNTGKKDTMNTIDTDGRIAMPICNVNNGSY